MSKNRMTRRSFLQTSAATTGALVTSKRLLLEPEPILAAPSDTLRFGIIGVGMQGNGLLATAVSLPGVQCVAAADLYDGRHTL